VVVADHLPFPLSVSLVVDNNNNNMKICNAHEISTWLNLRLKQSLRGVDDRSELRKLFKKYDLKVGRVWESWMSRGMLFQILGES